MIELNSHVISSVVGFILSYGIELVPSIKSWWEGFEQKELAIYATGLVVAAVMLGLRFAGAPIGGIEGDGWAIAAYVIGQWVAFVISTQATYVIQGGKEKLRG